VSGPHLTANGYWALEFVGSREWCYADGAWGSDGLFHLAAGTGVSGCFTIDTYQQYWVNSNGGDDGEPAGGDVGDGRPALGLTQHVGNLLFRELRPLHGPGSSPVGDRETNLLYFTLPYFSGGRSLAT
jgi:hypothetical protein